MRRFCAGVEGSGVSVLVGGVGREMHSAVQSLRASKLLLSTCAIIYVEKTRFRGITRRSRDASRDAQLYAHMRVNYTNA